MKPSRRKTLSKKNRFEVFKRDSFTCVYCGGKPPNVVLEIDHIDPVSLGGDNDINNLVTSCFDCNRGKSNTPLTNIPSKLSDHIETVKEKELQIVEYKKFLKSVKARETRLCNSIEKLYQLEYPKSTFSTNFKETTLKRIIRILPQDDVEAAMVIAIGKGFDRERCLQYFCGICWRVIKGENKYPLTNR